jgi:hypothetical protein
VGEYGLGKTEFVFQFCEHLLAHGGERSAAPLPVNLAMCRWMEPNIDEILDDPLNPEVFTELLFSPVLAGFSPGTPSFFEGELLPAIHRGEVLLILDGLDELVSNAHQHKKFFAGLRRFLDPSRLGLSRTKFQCLISMRLEYVMSVDTPAASNLVQQMQSSGNGHWRPMIHFLHLDFLNDSWIESYLRHTTNLHPDLEKFRALPGFYEVLHRPIFLQMLKVLDDAPFQFSAANLTHPVQLVRAIVTLAGGSERSAKDSPFQIERDQLAQLAGFFWDTDLLARAALVKFEATGPSFAFSAEDLKLFLLPLPSEAPAPLPTVDDAMHAVHKCPFLYKIRADSIVFAHKVFLEYFVARGIVLDLQRSGGAFERLVLNADMRKFLRFLIEETWPDEKDVWYHHTFRCGLDQPDQWDFPEPRQFEHLLPDLERIRRRLLDSMTEPRKIDVPATREIIEEFLALDDTHSLHPLYLMYNYEAVAVYLWRHRWHEDDVWLLDKFERRIDARATDLMRSLRPLQDEFALHAQWNQVPRETKELLVERISDIARRLQFRKVMEIKLEDYVDDGVIRSRMRGCAKNANEAGTLSMS